jgi:hypothetical protein
VLEAVAHAAAADFNVSLDEPIEGYADVEVERAGIDVRVAEPAETRLRQDRKRRAKTDKLDARLLRER